MRQQTVFERLEFVSKRIPGLKFINPLQGDDQTCFMSCDMFYIEIIVNHSHQTVQDVRISHGNDTKAISCPVLRKVLGDQDFETFAKHLAGLHAIYKIDTKDQKVKQRAYPALTALENDLTILYDHQRQRVTNCHDLVHKSPLGIMEPRKCGLPVRLTYFVTPYDLVDTEAKSLISLSINNIIEKNLGLSATVEIESSSPHKLQVNSLLSTQHNSSLPVYAPFNVMNSEKLPAQFVLNLSQPFPVLNTSINQIVNELINEPATIKEYLTTIAAKSKESLVSLIARQELDLNKGLFGRSVDLSRSTDSVSSDLRKHVYSVKLPDQYHTYHVLDNYLERHDGTYLTKIPFTHPTSIPSILRILRQQAQFNCLIGSCIRRSKSNSNIFNESTPLLGESSIFDLIPVSLNNLCISFEHPSKESLATLEIDLFKDFSCHLYALEKESVCTNEFATKVLQKCWSIPVTLRSVLKKCNARRLALLEDATKRREREVQELAQQELQFRPRLQYQETLLNNKPGNLNEKTGVHDLNSIAEFLSSKTNASTSDASNQTNADIESASNRSNLLKKFSCKPKAKQSTATKNQTGNKTILSLMLKRQNSSIDDPNLKIVKKAKTKNQVCESSVKGSASGTLTTKLVSPDVAKPSAIDQFAIKQGSLGSLKMTVTKTKPATTSSSLASTSSSTATLSSSTSSPSGSNSSIKIDAAKILGLGSSTPNIKYTIPKISKSQQASQSGPNPINPAESQSSANTQSDDSSNPSSSATSSASPSSTTSKRTTSTPFNRANNPNRNPVSSSTHPLGRITSNPLANATRKKKVDANSISSSRPQFANNMQQQTSIVAATNSIIANVCDSLQRPSPSIINAPPQFYIRQPMFEDSNNAVSSTPRVANEASQSSFINGRKIIELNVCAPQPTSAPIVIPVNNEMSSSTISPQVAGVSGNQGVSSTSDSKNQSAGTTISTPSSPTECDHAETVPPPPLIPIDSLDEPQPTSPGTDHPDDASDRLSIVDTNDNAADSNTGCSNV